MNNKQYRIMRCAFSFVCLLFLGLNRELRAQSEIFARDLFTYDVKRKIQVHDIDSKVFDVETSPPDCTSETRCIRIRWTTVRGKPDVLDLHTFVPAATNASLRSESEHWETRKYTPKLRLKQFVKGNWIDFLGFDSELAGWFRWGGEIQSLFEKNGVLPLFDHARTYPNSRAPRSILMSTTWVRDIVSGWIPGTHRSPHEVRSFRNAPGVWPKHSYTGNFTYSATLNTARRTSGQRGVHVTHTVTLTYAPLVPPATLALALAQRTKELKQSEIALPLWLRPFCAVRDWGFCQRKRDELRAEAMRELDDVRVFCVLYETLFEASLVHAFMDQVLRHNTAAKSQVLQRK